MMTDKKYLVTYIDKKSEMNGSMEVKAKTDILASEEIKKLLDSNYPWADFEVKASLVK